MILYRDSKGRTIFSYNESYQWLSRTLVRHLGITVLRCPWFLATSKDLCRSHFLWLFQSYHPLWKAPTLMLLVKLLPGLFYPGNSLFSLNLRNHFNVRISHFQSWPKRRGNVAFSVLMKEESSSSSQGPIVREYLCQSSLIIPFQYPYLHNFSDFFCISPRNF